MLPRTSTGLGASAAGSATERQHAGVDELIRLTRRQWQLVRCCESFGDLRQHEEAASAVTFHEFLPALVDIPEHDAVNALFNTELLELLLLNCSRGLQLLAVHTAAATTAAGPITLQTAALHNSVSLRLVKNMAIDMSSAIRGASRGIRHGVVEMAAGMTKLKSAIESSGKCTTECAVLFNVHCIADQVMH
jgi:hypothetical protein